MRFFRSILLLTGVTLCVLFAYFFGHALSTHEIRPVIIGTGLLVLGAGILAALSRDRVRW
jgi:ABC-type uncharacterized transport system permease subunit